MRLSQEQKDKIKKYWGDWEAVHGVYDEIALARLKELDPAFFEDLEEVTKGATFWYA